jgi:hypothetical protein
VREWAAGRIWIAEAPQRFWGLEFGARMTVVRLADGSLLVHSPIRLGDDLRREIDSLGPVRFAVAPNKLHHLYLTPFAEAYPEVRLYAAPGLPEKRPDLRFDAVLGDEPEPAWKGDLDQVLVRGSQVMQEMVFFHSEARTLIVADLCEHFGPWSAPLTRLLTRMARMYGRPRMPSDWQRTFRDREATRTSFERIVSWDFDRVILPHGRLLESGAKDLFRREYAWALR